MKRNCFEEHIMHGTVDFPVGMYDMHFEKENSVLFPVHYHKEFELLVVTSGKIKVQLEGDTVCLNQGNGIFINSCNLHSAINVGNTACSFIAIVFSPAFIALECDSLYKRFIRPIIKNEIEFPINLSNEVVNIVIETYNLFNMQTFGYELAIKGNITRMLSICIANSKKRSNVKNDSKYEIVKQVLDFIHINYGNIITLYDLSLQAHTSKEHLCRVFREVSDLSPVVYLNRYRIMQSAYMLCNTDKTISEISSCCGFNNSSYFNKLFMRFMKCTPTEYRCTHDKKGDSLKNV